MHNVAIACQGGGSHTAFTAGALQTLLSWLDRSDDRLVGLSGTSGGAFSAVGGWYGLLAPDASVTETLDALWGAIAACGPAGRLVNESVVWTARVESAGVPVPELSPYHNPFAEWGHEQLREALVSHVDFDAISELVDPAAPNLTVGAVDVNAGEFRTFENEEVTPRALLASAAVPELFEAVEIDGHYYWDGLFSQNPPIRDFFRVDAERKPDELWVVQINPQTRATVPKAHREIIDRRNELAGNISLNQELRFVESINGLVADGHLPSDEYRQTTIRRIELDSELSYSSKLDRSRAFVDELISEGRERAEAFVAER